MTRNSLSGKTAPANPTAFSNPLLFRTACSLIALHVSGALILWGSDNANAAEVSITTSRTTPIETKTANNGAAADISITKDGKVVVAGGTAATINSSNKITNAGTIESDAASGGTGILIDGTGGIAASLDNSGTIKLTGSTGHNTGILIKNGTVTGTITSAATGAISVAGDDSAGLDLQGQFNGDITLTSIGLSGKRSEAVSITGALNGNLSLKGSISTTGQDSTGLYIGGTVTGKISNGGSIVDGAAATRDSKNNVVDAVAGKGGVWIAGSVTGGFVNDRYYVDKNGAVVPPASVDTTKNFLVTASISSFGGASAILVAPDASNPHNVTVGAAGTGDDAYGIVNRGKIQATGSTAGRSVAAIKVGGATVNSTDYTATVTGGIASQANSSITASAVDATAIGIQIASGGQADKVWNGGAMTVATGVTAKTDTKSAGPGGDAIGILVDTGGSTATVRNSGAIFIAAGGTDKKAYGILDRAGTVTNIENTGTIVMASESGFARAIDVSANTTGVNMLNSGNILGDVVFGSGNDHLTTTANTLASSIDFGGGNNTLSLDGTATVAGKLLSSGSLAADIKGTSTLDMSQSSIHLASLTAAGQSTLVLSLKSTDAPALTIDGAAHFNDQSKIKLNLETLVGEAPLTILTATGGIDSDHASTLLSAAATPFMYANEGYHLTADSLVLNLRRKTAAELGFTAGQAAFYNNSIAVMAAHDDVLGTIGNIGTQAEFLSAYRQIMPPSYGSASIRMARAMQSASSTAATQRMDMIRQTNAAERGFGLWAQETGNFAHQRNSQGNPGYDSSMASFTIGADRPLSDRDLVGVSVSAAWGTASISGIDGHPLKVANQKLDLYSSFSLGSFYLQGILSAARNGYNSDYNVSIGSFAANRLAQWSGYQYGGQLIAGIDLKFGNLTLQPSDSISYMRLHQGGYKTEGTGHLDLSVASMNSSTVENTAQMAIKYDLPAKEGKIRIEARGAYVSLLSGRHIRTEAQFLSGGSSFDLVASDLARNEFKGGASIGYFGKDISFSLAYDYQRASGYRNHGLSVIVRMVF